MTNASQNQTLFFHPEPKLTITPELQTIMRIFLPRQGFTSFIVAYGIKKETTNMEATAKMAV